MGDMLANRYLLDGRATEALRRYRRAVRRAPHEPELQCRLILAQLEADRIEEAAALVLELLRQRGPQALAALRRGCAGYVPTDLPADGPALIGLRALLAGDAERARRYLGRIDPEALPVAAALARQLEAIDGT